ncbi:MBL fold metallo-hydrolase [Caldanaerobacter subterraneus]|uniref:Beta-lactamase superfamily hydrolase n=1 Tax=Caldanaerobacter subterraneus subsp. pacificus DSM 12653 TaxID=391606 RepID=B7R8L7_9THEO|nr:MBL fold metallo-hydrolase [Caldanaerobacter subterraneus]KKC29418.1 beta-lactamase superfamily hydrolase [Caldanaerobacter subterraneus subsp. pacificus DSM 12653]
MLEKLIITVLAEDSVLYESPFLGQHGVCFFVEAYGKEKRNILIDVGQNIQAIAHNMELMGISFKEIDAIVLTHCHYDHTQGIVEVLELIGKKEVSVVAHPDIFRLNFITDPFIRHVGVMREGIKEKIEENGGRLFLTRDPLEIMPGVMTTGEVERVTDFEEVGISLKTITEDGRIVEDVMKDDISFVANIKGKGIVIISGCSHAGIVNITKRAVKLTGEDKILAIIGGLHLIDASSERISKTVQALKEFDIELISAGHCTGFKAQVELYKAFGERFVPLHTGMKFEF